MQFEEYEIIRIKSEVSKVYEVHVKPKKKKQITQFKPGQFFHIKNPTYQKPHETRAFSITSTPSTPQHMAFCVKTYGPWTQDLLKKKRGDSVWLFGPMGAFTLKEEVTNAIFIAGGVGITPILSILQSLDERNQELPITLIYANKTPDAILKKEYVEEMFDKKSHWKLHSLISSVSGHITKEFLEQNIAYSKNSTFFICGSQRFTKNIIEVLASCGIERSAIKQEIFSAPLIPTQ
jgi:ferredoxin-NADP reductase